MPEDISLTGGDRIDLACDLSMTGIIQEYETLAGKALRLIKKSSGKNRWKKMRLPKIGKSCVFSAEGLSDSESPGIIRSAKRNQKSSLKTQ